MPFYKLQLGQHDFGVLLVSEVLIVGVSLHIALHTVGIEDQAIISEIYVALSLKVYADTHYSKWGRSIVLYKLIIASVDLTESVLLFNASILLAFVHASAH